MISLQKRVLSREHTKVVRSKTEIKQGDKAAPPSAQVGVQRLWGLRPGEALCLCCVAGRKTPGEGRSTGPCWTVARLQEGSTNHRDLSTGETGFKVESMARH